MLDSTVKMVLDTGLSVMQTRPDRKCWIDNWSTYHDKNVLVTRERAYKPTDALPSLKTASLIIPHDMIVIDVDVGEKSGRIKHGLDSLEKLQRDAGGVDLLELSTYVARTQSGGYHIYFRHNGLKKRKTLRAYPDIEFLTRGCQCLLPGSVGVKGNYTIHRGKDNFQDLCVLPDAVEELFHPRQSAEMMPSPTPPALAIVTNASQRYSAYLEKMGPAVEGQGADDRTYRACCVARDFGLSREEAMEVLRVWNSHNPRPWSEKQLADKLENAFRYATGQIGSKIDTHHMVMSPNVGGVMEMAPPVKDKSSKKEKASFAQMGELIYEKYDFKNKLYYNEFSKNIMISNDVPWYRGDSSGYHVFSNDDLKHCRMLVSEMGTEVTTEALHEIVHVLARRQSTDPLRDYFGRLPEWDGIERVEYFFSKYCGAVDDKYTRTVSYTLLMGIVHRANNPGCKFDHIIVLVGREGIRKSTLIQTLSIKEDWYTSTTQNITNAVTFVQLTAGKLLLEWAELAGLQSKDSDTLKGFISTAVDRCRLPYERLSEDVPRRSVIIGTANSMDFLHSPTGNRKILPVMLDQPIDTDAVAQDLPQIYAEAMHMMRQGKQPYVELDEEFRHIRDEVHQLNTPDDPWEDDVMKYAIENQRFGFTLRDLIFGAFYAEDANSIFRNPHSVRRISDILIRNKFMKSRKTDEYGMRVRVYKRPQQ